MLTTTQIQSSEQPETGFLNRKKEQDLPVSSVFSDMFSMMKTASDIEASVDTEGVEPFPSGLPVSLLAGLTEDKLAETPLELENGLPYGLAGEFPSGLVQELPPGLVVSSSGLEMSEEQPNLVIPMSGDNLQADSAALDAVDLNAKVFRAGGGQEVPPSGVEQSLQELVNQLASRPKSILTSDEVVSNKLEVSELIDDQELGLPTSLIGTSDLLEAPVEQASLEASNLGFGESELLVEDITSGRPNNGQIPHEAYAEKNSGADAVEQVSNEAIDADKAKLAQMNVLQAAEQSVATGAAVAPVQNGPVSAVQAVTPSSNSNTQAALNSTPSWGAQSSDGQPSQAAGQQSGQSGQNGEGQPSQQQAMMFAQAAQEGKERATEQQQAVKLVDEANTKYEIRDLLGGAEIASSDRRTQLPLGLQAITVPVRHPQWGQALGQKIVFMANNSLQQAQITLNPENLGKIQVVMKLDKDKVMNVTLTAQNGTTRESMENALPRLREMLEQAGINLGSVDVSEQKQFSEEASGQSEHKTSSAGSNLVDEGSQEESSPSIVKSTDSLVDYYV
ncbi:MAG: hypothetical protein ISEC1_P0103 [Thiomicrorhabdus sp.]|nr:MAG: hypothetical protein ISEC1_P0103 [Thiomicrorhabdus sp.]